ncbi:PREDICTED: condensin complex subunit 1 [Nicrophorus vespilloides]|uniref:Condensin complex subunit 1 n=1 Tax=Nicrophorus vespilloides TaxID=110193 RepID=A0ABM1NIU0_NICVS|nr:PREDICTED: condensin complex subunit 1 [Nicrophorus vespilloides]
MSHINFVIPQNRNELLSESDDQYFVKTIINPREITTTLNVAKGCYKDEGPTYISDNFDIYFSILHQADQLPMEMLFTAYEHLHKATQDLIKSLIFLLEDKDSVNEEMKMKYNTIIKMLMYLYTSIVQVIDHKNEMNFVQSVNRKSKGKKKKNPDAFMHSIERKSVVIVLHQLIQQDLRFFFNSPSVDDTFIKLLTDVCYGFLEAPTIKGEKETRQEIFNFLGYLVVHEGHGMAFVIRLVQLVKTYEHLTICISEGVQHLIQNHNCKMLIRDLVREITEWQVDEKFADSQGTRFCSMVLTQMAVQMPDLMIPEVMYLNKYLAHDSYHLRNSVLSVMVEVILAALTRNDLNEEEKESRDELLEILEEHIADVAASVRSKVFQHWCRLQKENAVPVKMQNVILEKAIFHLRDKAANVRKVAANCVTTFLEYNLFGAKLELGKLREELAEKKGLLDKLKSELDDLKLNKLTELEQEWLEKENEIKAVVESNINKSSNEKSMEIDENVDSSIVRFYIMEGKYEDAFKIFEKVAANSDNFQNIKENMSNDDVAGFYLMLLKSMFLKIPDHINEVINSNTQNKNAVPTEEHLERLEALSTTVDFLQTSVSFLELLDQAMKPMIDLLYSVNISDMTEAVNFFIAAYNFKLDNALIGVLEILKAIRSCDHDRKDIILNAMKTIYLTTSAENMEDHTTTIVERLIDLLRTISMDNLQDLNSIIAEWVEKGTLDNSVIDMLWQYVTLKKQDVCKDKSRAALTILTMAAKGRKTIVTRNIKLVGTIGFGERGQDDILLATHACHMLCVSSMDVRNISDPNPPNRIYANDEMWKSLRDMVVTNFDKRVKFFNGFLSAAVELIFRLCSTPLVVIEDILKTALVKIGDATEESSLEAFLLIRMNVLVGEIAIRFLNFMDEDIYKELKRRQFIRRDKKKNNNKSLRKRNNVSLSASQSSCSTDATATDDSILEGAQACDADADYISDLLENRTVSSSSTLGKLSRHIVYQCENPNTFNEEHVQCSAISALLRLMLVSSDFCSKHIQLIFTILEKTSFEDVKISILVHCSDLLEKYPNIVEPYTPRLFLRLEDKSVEIRKSAFFILSNLILRDMIRAQGHISEMAISIVDEEDDMRQMASNFFVQLSHKANNLYTVLPDIFTHLCDKVKDEEQLKTILKFLFGLIDNNKQMESLVDRFCAKYRLSEDENVAKNITFCLTLINYNERSLKKLSENFELYKNFVLVNDVYLYLKQILANCTKGVVKQEIKDRVTELEGKIKGMFELTEGAKMPDVPKKVTRKSKNKSLAKKKQVKKRSKVESDSDSSD